MLIIIKFNKLLLLKVIKLSTIQSRLSSVYIYISLVRNTTLKRSGYSDNNCDSERQEGIIEKRVEIKGSSGESEGRVQIEERGLKYMGGQWWGRSIERYISTYRR